MKTCVACQETKATGEFHKNRGAKDGLQSNCKACKAAHGIQWRRDNAERIRENNRAWQQANPDRTREYCRRWSRENPEQNRERNRVWREANPEKVRANVRSWQQANSDRMAPTARARQAVYRAIQRGDLVRPDACEQCGSGRNITAAHHNYQEPLSVRWLCRSCHTRWDAATPKTLVAS